MTVFEQVQAIIADNLNISKDKVTLNANLADDLGADSLDAVEIIMNLEESFNISIADDAAEKIKTVKDLVDYIEEQSSK